MFNFGPIRVFLVPVTLLAVGLSSAARAQVSLTLGDTTLSPGDSGSITASIATDGSAVALQFDVLYDPAVLILGTVSGGGNTGCGLIGRARPLRQGFGGSEGGACVLKE